MSEAKSKAAEHTPQCAGPFADVRDCPVHQKDVVGEVATGWIDGVQKLQSQLAAANYVINAARGAISGHNGGKGCSCHLHDAIAAYDSVYGAVMTRGWMGASAEIDPLEGAMSEAKSSKAAQQVVDAQGRAIPPYDIRCTFSGPSGMNSYILCHITLAGKSLCGRNAHNWSNRYNFFRSDVDCKRCAKKAGLAMTTDTKRAPTPGAIRAAIVMCGSVYDKLYVQGGLPDTWGTTRGWATPEQVAEIISANTHDGELLEALEQLVKAEWMVSPDWSGGEKRNKVITKAEAAIRRAKEGL